MGAQLKKKGIEDFVILEKAAAVGGTWRENIYPGVACDVPSHLYSFSFELNPNWSHSYGAGQEIWDYCEQCTTSYGLRDHLSLNTEIQEAKFNGKKWEITTKNNIQWLADIVVSGLGGLHHPKHLDIKGLDSFNGDIFHTAEWNNKLSMNGKRVAIVGTGASAAQVLPNIADKVAEVTVFQRSPAWVLPRMARGIPAKRRQLFKKYPFFMRLYRLGLWILLDCLGVLSLKNNGLLQGRLKKLCEKHIQRSVRDPELRKKLTPSYTPGCKRRCVSDDYLRTYNRQNVHLCTNHIELIEPDGIRDKTGQLHKVDIIIEATGFQAFDVATYLNIQGRNQRRLQDEWKNRITAYRSVMVPGYPNLFFLLGPNSGTGHTSALIMIESQVQFVIKSLNTMRRKGIKYLEPSAEKTDKFNARIQKDMKKMVFHSGCNAWYTNEKDENFTLWPYSAARFVTEMKTFKSKDLVGTSND